MNNTFQSGQAASGRPKDPRLNGSTDASNILTALEIIHSPSTKNEVRKQASDFLESLKSNDDAANYGVLLGSDAQQPPLVRHFGLSLIDHVVRHKWHQQSEVQNAQLRGWVIDLGKALVESDPPFIRNKVAELWIEVAKRSWALDWFELDEQLVNLWEESLVLKEFVLNVLENLSEDIITREDSTAVLRGADLNNAIVEIFTSPADFAGALKINSQFIKLRAGDDGWLARITRLLEQCPSNNLAFKSTSKKCLAALRSALGWIMTPAIIHAGTLPSICSCLSSDDADILIAATDCLVTLYNRTRLEISDIKALVIPLCCTENVISLRDLYRKSLVGVEDIDSPRYLISKKLSEMVSYLAGLLMHTPHEELAELNVSPFLDFMMEICQHDSLIVSIPIVHAWTKMLGPGKWRKSTAVANCVGPLLQFACQRTIQYDLLGDASEEPTVVFVNDEIELATERSGFFLNYRRLCCQIIELICYTHLAQAIPYLLTRVDNELDGLQRIDRQFDPRNYHKSQISLQLDSQCSNVEYALRGFSTWRIDHSEKRSAEQELQQATIGLQIRGWSDDFLVKRDFKDPFAKQRVIKCVVEISSRALEQDNDFALKVLEHIMTAFIPDQPENEAYTEAVQELHLYAARELRHLASQHADYFITFYDQFEAKLRELSSTDEMPPQAQADLSAALFLIVQRATTIDDASRKDRLWNFMEPLLIAWQDDGVLYAVSTFEAFASSQCFDQVVPYLLSVNAPDREAWSAIALDARGAQLQSEMAQRLSRMPLRLTRTILANSTDKLPKSSPTYLMTCELWSLVLPHMVQSVFRIVSYTHQLHDPTRWPNVPAGKEGIVSRVLRDRFWQSGITDGSKDDFYAMIKSSKRSLEGFASSVRNKLRLNIEQTYTIIHSLSKLGETFYGVPHMAEVFSQAVVSSARPLSPHHYLLFLTMVSRLIDDCPPAQRDIFLGSVLPVLLSEIDQKCTNEWTKLENRDSASADKSEDLTIEMREESLLRQLTHKAVSMVSQWVDYHKEQQRAMQKMHAANGANGFTTPVPLMSSYVFSSAAVLPPLLFFYSHALSYRDTKSCAIVACTLRLMVLAFVMRPTKSEAHPDALDEETTAAVREFMSTDMLKAAITSLNDGYYADQQKDLAMLIAAIWTSFGLPTHIPATETQASYERPAYTQAPRNVMLSLPGLTDEKIDAAGRRLVEDAHHRHQRAVILELLEGFRGVRLSELGKIDTKAQKSKLIEKYMMRDSMGMQGLDDGGQGGAKGEDVDLGGVQEMFA